MRSDKELAELIIKGLSNPNFTENISCFLKQNYKQSRPNQGGEILASGCAIGAAFTGLIGNLSSAVDQYKEAAEKFKSPNDPYDFFAGILNITSENVAKVSYTHNQNKTPASKIAQMLNQGRF